MFNSMGLINDTTGIHTNVSCSCNCKHTTSFQSTEISQLEFVQILVIVVVMMVMVVVITCLLNHYRLSAYSLLTRHTAARRQHIPFTSDSSLWPSDGLGPSSGASEQQASGSRSIDPTASRGGGGGGGVGSGGGGGMGVGRFQPTWPYLQHSIIELPPTISLSDGEEPPPYQGPCTLQLRDPEQQLELNRESVRAPPNRTIYDGPLVGLPCPPSTYSGSGGGGSGGTGPLSSGGYPNQSRQEGAPPTYSEAVGHFYHLSSPPRHLRAGGGGPGSLVPNPTPLIQALENRNARNKEKQKVQHV